MGNRSRRETRTSRSWLEDVLAGADISPRTLRRLVKDCPTEDQHLEYKSGKMKDAKEGIREAVAAFANSDGGLLLVGYDEGADCFDGFSAPGGGSAVKWATSVIFGMAPEFSPQPRIAEVRFGTEKLHVLVIAVGRAPRLIPVIKSGELRYPLRIGESNRIAPPYLVADLVLGRRNHPVLRPHIERPRVRSAGPLSPAKEQGFLDIILTVENASLGFAEDVRVGLVAWGARVGGRRAGEADAPSDSLLANVEKLAPQKYSLPGGQPPWQIFHARKVYTDGVVELGPYERSHFITLESLPVPIFPNVSDLLREPQLASEPAGLNAEEMASLRAYKGLLRLQGRGAVSLRVALYVAARNAPPLWFEVTVGYAKEGVLPTEVRPFGGHRPHVTASFIGVHDFPDKLSD